MLSGVVCDDDVRPQSERQTQNDDSDFFEIDSLTSLQRALVEKPRKIFINSNEEFISKNVFNSRIKIEGVSDLKVRTDHLSIMYKEGLRQLIKGGVQTLSIEADVIQGPEELVESFFFYSSLQSLRIECRMYKNVNDSRVEENYDEIRNRVNLKCQKIVNLNNKTKEFIENDLVGYREREGELELLKADNLKELSDLQVKEAISIAGKREFFNDIIKFSSELSEDSTFRLLREVADEWTLARIVSTGQTHQFERIKPFLSEFDVNCRIHSIGNIFNRYIDLATGNRHIDMVILLHEMGAHITRDCTEDSIPYRLRRYGNAARNLPNFPFFRALKSDNKALEEYFIGQDESLYDGLAWLIYIGDIETFKSVCRNKRIDFNKVISSGVFRDFNLFQLVVFYQRTQFFFEYNNSHFQEILELLGGIYPGRESFEYSGWSVFAVLVYNGCFEELNWCAKSVDLLKVNYATKQNYNPIQLLLVGSTMRLDSDFEMFHARGERDNKQERKLERYQKCLGILIGSKFSTEAELDMYSDETKCQLPVAHFCVASGIFQVIRPYEELYRDQLLRKVEITFKNGKDSLNPLQLAVAFSHFYYELPTILFELYEKEGLLEAITDPLPILGLANLFQFCLIRCNRSLLIRLINWEGCPVNIPFPDTHLEYPTWMPIHVVILLEKIDRLKGCLPELLQRGDVDISVPFPGRGIPHYIENYYPSTAIFYSRAGSGSPKKNDMTTGRIMSSALEFFLPSIRQLPLKKKRDILNQGLLYAIAHHSVTGGFAYEEQIQKLTEEGADPYQTFGENGDRIIDLARERGLLHLFPRHLEDRMRSVTQKILLISGNRRESELNSFSKTTLEVNEDYYSVVSLVRNEKSGNPEHVFIVVEQIIQGRSNMHFIDFVIDQDKYGLGKVRHFTARGRITDALLFSCQLSMMRINEIEDLKCQSWGITNEAADTLFKSIGIDRNKEIPYALAGDRSIFTWSSSKKGHNCYTWAREKLMGTGAPKIEQVLTPTLGEWLITIPSLKESRSCTRKYLLYSAAALGIGLGGLSYYLNLFNSEASLSKFEL